MRKGLKNGDAVFGAVTRMPKRCKRQPVRRAITEIKLAVGVKILVLGINELGFGRGDHADKFVPCGRVRIQPSNPNQVIQLWLAHAVMS